MSRYCTPRAKPVNPGHRLLYHAVINGREPAESLPTHLRWQLVSDLHRRGWTDLQIATHTFMTTYTTARIRGGLGLAPNREQPEGMTA